MEESKSASVGEAMTGKNGGPAFPSQDNVMGTMLGGLSKREWFAGMALQGFLSQLAHPLADPLVVIDGKKLAKTTYRIADAMIEESNREQGESNGK